MHNPGITVLMPVYNAGKYIREAICSVLAQSFTDFELLIVNDGSTDETLSVIDTFSDHRIRVINQPNGGVAAALNTGLRHASASYIARFDADDVCYPQRLQVQYDFMEANPSYSIIGSAADYTDVAGNYVFTHYPPAFTHEEISRLSIRVCPFIHSSVFYRRDTILRAGGYNEHAHTFEDHLLWVNVLKKERTHNLRDVLIKVRLNPESITIDEKWRTRRFRRIKYAALQKSGITAAEGMHLSAISKKQRHLQISEGAYYALLGKKYLWNNHHPHKARKNLLKTLAIHPLRSTNYALLLLSFLPGKILSFLYRSVKITFGKKFTYGR